MEDSATTAVEWLERHYDWRDAFRDADNNLRGWIPNCMAPDEVLTFNGRTHGQPAPDGRTYRYYQEIYRHDLFQWEDAMLGNSDCSFSDKFQEGCFCYAWPGAVHSLEWTAEDEAKWMSGELYSYTDSCLRDSRLSSHLTKRYGESPYYFREHPNDVVLVIYPEDENDTRKAKAVSHAAAASGQHDKAEEGHPDGGIVPVPQGGTTVSGSAVGNAVRSGF